MRKSGVLRTFLCLACAVVHAHFGSYGSVPLNTVDPLINSLIGYKITFTGSSGDTTSPSLVTGSFSFAPNAIDVTTAQKTVTVTLSATDGGLLANSISSDLFSPLS